MSLRPNLVLYSTNHAQARIRTVMSMNQLNSNDPKYTTNFFFGSMYWIMELTSFGFAAVLIALTMTVAAAVPSMLRAVPTIVWSALKLIAATASSDE